MNEEIIIILSVICIVQFALIGYIADRARNTENKVNIIVHWILENRKVK